MRTFTYLCLALVAATLALPAQAQTAKKDDPLGGLFDQKTEPAKKVQDPLGGLVGDKKAPGTDPLGALPGDRKAPDGDPLGGLPGEKGAKTAKPGEKGGKDKEGKEKEEPKFTYGTSFVGTVKSMGSGGPGDLVIEIKSKVQVPRSSAASDLARWQNDIARIKNQIYQEQVRMAQARSPQSAQQHAYNIQRETVQLQQRMAQPPQLYDLKDVQQDVPMKLAEDVRIRVSFPELQYDDKGRPLQFTKEMLQKLKGPENLPGYPAEMLALRPGQTVQVYLPRQERKGRQPQPGKTNEKKEEKKDDPFAILGGGKTPEPPAVGAPAAQPGQPPQLDPTAQNLPVAVMIVIIQDNLQPRQ